MLKVGLTGNIGSGKSTVAELFKKLGVPVFHADTEAKLILDDLSIIKLLVEKIGGHILDPISGKIDRKVFASVIFNDASFLKYVNGLIHAQVREKWEKWLENQKFPMGIEEAAILFESGHADAFDKIILVTAPEDLRIERVMQRDKVSREKVIERINNQWPEEQKVALADFIIYNDGTHELWPQIQDVFETLMQEAQNL